MSDLHSCSSPCGTDVRGWFRTIRLHQFHIAPWEDRMDLVRQMQDQRFARIGQRLIYYEKPDLLSDPTKEKIRNDFSSYEEIFPDRPPLSVML